jgi:hypothetical protein
MAIKHRSQLCLWEKQHSRGYILTVRGLLDRNLLPSQALMPKAAAGSLGNSSSLDDFGYFFAPPKLSS